MSIKEILREMDNYYERLCACSSSTGRRYNGQAMIELAQNHPEINEYWEINLNYFHWENRFKKIKDFQEEEQIIFNGVKDKSYTIKNYGQADFNTVTDYIVSHASDYMETKEVWNDGINFDLPEKPGLYMIGEITYNPDLNKLLYGIKVGKGKNLKNRIASYKTCGSTPFVCDYLLVPMEKLDYVEKICHFALNGLCLGLNAHNTEWFYMDEKTYFEMTSKGFSFFNN